MSDWAYELGRTLSWALFNAAADVIVEGAEHTPEDGPCLFVANHISHFDPNLLGMPLGRPIDYMATEELFSPEIVGKLLLSWNAFPVQRTKVDRAAIREALDRLKKGRVVGIFPERGIRHGERSVLTGAPLAPGTASLVQMAKVPVLPAVILGSDQLYQWRSLYRRPRIFIRYGSVIHWNDSLDRNVLSDQIARALREMYEGLIADHLISNRELPHSAQERWALK